MPERNQRLEVIGIGILCLFLLGCSRESFRISSKEESSTVVLQEEIVLTPEITKEDFSEKDQKEEEKKPQEITAEEIAVHICGAVKHPGVYFFKEKQRIYDGIIKAGGFREDADEEYLNQALFLEDGMKIVVPTKEETAFLKESKEGAEVQLQFSGTSVLVQGKEETGKIDLNTADKTLLCTLPGIGESRAESIIAYRQEHGKFERTEDVMKVSGIKEAAYEKIKEFITVSK